MSIINYVTRSEKKVTKYWEDHERKDDLFIALNFFDTL